MNNKVPRANLKSILKKKKPHLRLATNTDVLVHLSLLLFLHRLAEESRAKAFENRSSTIKPDHVLKVAKGVLRRARG
ncbi:centromere protein W [Huso huso]|uniref:Centromere protein W n=2 Tax=Acipenseridae TaxID=7900 RepID=A0AAD8GBA5_ACIOX|nr:centromere protein W [Acipenser ruthenus]KAK1171157.1 centromere protein W [Acipenser oxyrinchus oxyrinchus]